MNKEMNERTNEGKTEIELTKHMIPDTNGESLLKRSSSHSRSSPVLQ